MIVKFRFTYSFFRDSYFTTFIWPGGHIPLHHLVKSMLLNELRNSFILTTTIQTLILTWLRFVSLGIKGELKQETHPVGVHVLQAYCLQDSSLSGPFIVMVMRPGQASQ